MRSIQFTAKIIYNQFRIQLFKYKRLNNAQIDELIRDYTYTISHFTSIENLTKFRMHKSRRYIYLFAAVKVNGTLITNDNETNNLILVRGYLENKFRGNNYTGAIEILVQDFNIKELE